MKKTKIISVLSFITPVILLAIVYIFTGILFGDKSILINDMSICRINAIFQRSFSGEERFSL